jgi:hypothetical protein
MRVVKHRNVIKYKNKRQILGKYQFSFAVKAAKKKKRSDTYLICVCTLLQSLERLKI